MASKEFIVSRFFRLQNFNAMKIVYSNQTLLLQIFQDKPGSFFIEMEDATKSVEYARKWNDSVFATCLLDLRHDDMV